MIEEVRKMVPLVEHGGERISRDEYFINPATILAHFGEELSYQEIEEGLYLFEKADQEKIIAGVRQKQYEFWNRIEIVEYYRSIHWQLPGMEEHAKKTLESLDLQEGHIIVDLGCGWGRVAEQLLEFKVNFSYIGIDFSDEMLKVARNEIIKRSEGRVKFQNYNLTEGIPLDNSYADRVLSNWGIVYLPQRELRKVMEEVRRVLKPGGIFVCAAMVAGVNFMLLALRSLLLHPLESFRKRKVIREGIKFGADIKRLFPLYTTEQLALMIYEGGLEIIDIYPTIWGRSITIVAQNRPWVISLSATPPGEA